MERPTEQRRLPGFSPAGERVWCSAAGLLEQMRSQGGPSLFAVARLPSYGSAGRPEGLLEAGQTLRGGTDLTRPHGGDWHRSANHRRPPMAYGPMCSRLLQEEAVPTGHERGIGDGPWIATHTEARDCRACLLTLVIGLSTGQRQRRTIAEIRARSESHAKALGKVRLLEFRAADLSIQVEELEQRRDVLGDAGTEVLDLRALLAKGGRKADLKVVSREPAQR